MLIFPIKQKSVEDILYYHNDSIYIFVDYSYQIGARILGHLEHVKHHDKYSLIVMEINIHEQMVTGSVYAYA